MRIGVTGSEGFIGGATAAALSGAGHEIRGLDIRLPPGAPGSGSILDKDALRRLCDGCDGVLHFAAVSRVAHGEADPERCEATNVTGTANVLEAAAAASMRGRPWVLFASSREVYGEPRELPVREDAPFLAINHYGRSKVRGEELVMAAREAGLAVAVLRFANVYGPGRDHPDRVVPAFARAAARGGELRIEGGDNTFDFTHITDVVSGILTVADALSRGERLLPPIHLASGRGTTLLELAKMAVAASPAGARLKVGGSLSYNVSRFVGDPARARALLGWSARRTIEEGIREAVAGAASSM